MRDLVNSLKVQPGLNAATIATNTTTNGAIIDLKDFEGVMWAVQAATITDGSYAVSIQVGDQANLSDGATATGTDVLGSANFVATDDNVTKKIGYVGIKRYARLQIVSTGVTSGGAFAAVAVQGFARHAGKVG